MPKPAGLDLDKLEPHPFANIFHMLDTGDATALAASIQRDGLLEKIVIFQGKILDGRNRYRALKAIEEPLVWDFHFEHLECSEVEALNFVESKNIERRHLTAGQRALAAADFLEIRGGFNISPGRARLGHEEKAARERAAAAEMKAATAKKFGTTESQIDNARRLRDGGPKALVEMVRAGEVALQKAETIRKALPMSALHNVRTPRQANAAAKRAAAVYETPNQMHNLFKIANALHETEIADVAELFDEKGHRIERLETAVAQLTRLLDQIRALKPWEKTEAA